MCVPTLLLPLRPDGAAGGVRGGRPLLLLPPLPPSPRGVVTHGRRVALGRPVAPTAAAVPKACAYGDRRPSKSFERGYWARGLRRAIDDLSLLLGCAYTIKEKESCKTSEKEPVEKRDCAWW